MRVGIISRFGDGLDLAIDAKRDGHEVKCWIQDHKRRHEIFEGLVDKVDDYQKFKLVFGEVRTQLKKLPGFMHLTWWVHPQDPGWYNEISIWTSLEALKEWHMNTYHKNAKEACHAAFDSHTAYES